MALRRFVPWPGHVWRRSHLIAGDYLKQVLSLNPKVILNLSDVSYIDSGGWEPWSEFIRRPARRGRHQALWLRAALAGCAASYQAGYGFRGYDTEAEGSQPFAGPLSGRILACGSALPCHHFPISRSFSRSMAVPTIPARAGIQFRSLSQPGFRSGERAKEPLPGSQSFHRRPQADKDLVVADPRVSRDHAIIVSENGKFSSLTRAVNTVPLLMANG